MEPTAPRTSSPTPVLPRHAAAEGDDAITSLRRFHFAPAEGGAALPDGLAPALLAAFRGASVRTDYPLFLAPAAAGPGALPLPFADLLGRVTPSDEGARLLRDNLRRVERRLAERLAGTSAPVDAREAFAAATTGLAAEIGLAEEDAERLEADLEAMVAAVPAGGRLLPWSDEAPLHLLLGAARARLSPARTAFVEEARRLAATLGTMLGDAAGSGDPAAALGGAMGSLGGRFLDPGRLAGELAERRRGHELTAERRARLDRARTALAGFAAAGAEPALTLVCAPGRGAAPAGWKLVESAEPFAAAADRFDVAAADLAEVLRAARVARLELDGTYDADRHGPALARLDWQSFSREELALLPPVVALAEADHAAGEGLLPLSRLLLSGRPVQVLLAVEPAGNPGAGAEALTRFRFEPGSLGLGHREAFVQQTSSVRPAHMAAGFAAAAGAARCALHVVDVVPAERAGLSPWLIANAALEGRAQALFHYDPEAGEGWARRLSFAANPAPESDWPAAELAARREGGGEESLDLAFTFADFALLDPAYQGHYLTVPAGAEHEDLVPLDRWLRLAGDDAFQKVPTVWAVDPRGRLVRLVVSRPLALACRDRLSHWRTLQEMAGVRSEHVDRAAERARGEAEAAAAQERERLEAAHAAELERVRRQAAEEVVDRLTASLLDLDLAALGVAGAGGGLRVAGSVEEVTASLLAAVTAESLDAPAAPADEEVERVTAELLGLVDAAALAEEPTA